MVTPTYPGIYVEEVSSGVRPITAASTSTAAFIGVAEKGSLTEAVRIFNFTEFENLYGGFLTGSYLAHAVFQFFNNGGSICYVVRVASDDAATADIEIIDRAVPPAVPPQVSLTISAASPGIWGNRLEIEITDGTLNPANEFNLSVFEEGGATPLQTFENLSMVPTAANFVENATSRSFHIRVAVNNDNDSAESGTSRGAAAPSVPLPPGQTSLRINIDNDGYRDIDLQDAVTAGDVPNLDSDANVATAIESLMTSLLPQLGSTLLAAYSGFTAAVDASVLLLTSGTTGITSSVTVLTASISDDDATGLLSLGILNGGVETLGGAVTRPQPHSVLTAPRYRVGDHNAASEAAVNAVNLGSDGTAITNDQPYIDAFPRIDDKNDVSLIAVPGIGSSTVVGEGMNYCGGTRPLNDCFFIGDTGQDIDTVGEAQSFVAGISPKNSYGAVYVPWLLGLDPTGISAEPIAVPPSGYVAGMYAKTDALRGVWKAPAGTGAAVAGATGLAANFTDVQQGLLNPSPVNVNVIREFAASGRVVWGARTITSDAEWRYVPVRRTAIFLRVSIYNGIQWAVFEPNDEPLWAQLRLNITSFMMTLFRRGAFQGASADQAFFVKCDSETTTQDDIDQGIVNVLIGFAPLKPAEFVIVKISQKAGQTA